MWCKHTEYNNCFVVLALHLPFIFSKRLYSTFFQSSLYLQRDQMFNLPKRQNLSSKPSRNQSLLSLEDVDFAGVFQRLSPVAEPHSHHFPVIVQLSCNFCNLLACGQCILLKVGVKNLYCLRCETRTSLPFFGWFTANKLHQILLAFLVPVLSFSQPLLQHRLQLLSTLRGDVQLFKPVI